MRDFEGPKHSVHFYFHCGATENWQARVVPQKYEQTVQQRPAISENKQKCQVLCRELLWLSVVVHPLVLATAPQSRVPNRTNFLSGYVLSRNIFHNYLLRFLSLSLSTTCCSSSSCVNTWRTLLSIQFKSYVTRISIITALLQSASLTSGYL